MNDKAKTALEGSIAKWQAIVAGTGKDLGPANCPLCQEFWKAGCVGCPVYSATGHSYCHRTPYDDWIEEWPKRSSVGSTVNSAWASAPRERLRALAQAELDFLISLRPEGE